MKNNSMICILLVALFVSACSKTTGREKYVLLSQNQASRTATTNLEAISIGPIQNASFNKKYEFFIETSDSVLKINDSFNNYKVFKIPVTSQNETINIQLKSYCDCAGFTKQIVSPVSYIVDENGNLVTDSSMNFRLSQASFSQPFHLSGSKTVILPSAGGHYLVVAADNRYPDEVIGKAEIRGVLILPGWNKTTIEGIGGGGVDVKNHPTGKLQLLIEKK